MAVLLEGETDLGVIVKKHESGIRQTDKGHQFMTGNIGDTLVRGADKKCRLISKDEMREREASAVPKETAAQKRARLAAEAVQNGNPGSTADTGSSQNGAGAGGDTGVTGTDENGAGSGGTGTGDTGAAQ
ncbi:hypothetical protein [Sulfuricurvum sp.]|uniref:hypothetical protein n=1 Tax=Sulfuricurvum sp. TaxID=2025608 RepID=UPI00263633E1|nr:hypothetical protein [Sulfuricurvum sp.]MDD2267657.1 hypothetical protein [Sulfuricurvum sp.]MDD2784254.1 hypothetical protein [Sulfuricurvum sp.]